MLLTLLALEFHYDQNDFVLNGNKIQIIAGEMHPSRIPYQYWEHRIKMAKAMGCNTIAIYIFWNAHEVSEGVFDFDTPQNNMSNFLELCEKNDMLVALRPGPYVCAEWDFGGIPVRLLKNATAQFRTKNDPNYRDGYTKYIAGLAKNIAPHHWKNGGSLVMVQIENEYGSWEKERQDRPYLDELAEIWINNGIDGPFFSADGSWLLSDTCRIDGAAIGVNGGCGDGDFEAARKCDPNVPYMVTELYPGWLRHWGESDWEPSDVEGYVKDYLNKFESFNYYVIHGGTNFGLTAGANSGGYGFEPDLTSYDYGSPIGESGIARPLYYKYRDQLEEASTTTFIDIPEPIPTEQIVNVQLERIAGLWDERTIEEPELSEPTYLENYLQNQGFAIYSTTLQTGASGKLKFSNVRDYAEVYLNDRLLKIISRVDTNDYSLDLETVEAPGKLEVFVEAMGHINYAMDMERDRKGIYGQVTLDGKTVTGWKLSRLPFEHILTDLVEKDQESYRAGGIFRGAFTTKQQADTWFEMTGYEKGYVIVNGYNLGRYWTAKGPQQRLFCPGVWLNEGDNEILVVDMTRQEPALVTGYELYSGCPDGQHQSGNECVAN